MTRCIVAAINVGLQFNPQGLRQVAGVDVPYSETIGAINGQPPYRFEHVSGLLPAGVTFDDNGDGTATFSGTPTVAGTFPATIRLTDWERSEREQVFTVQVIALPMAISGSLADASVGTVYNDTLTVTGGVAPYTLGSIALPAGLSASILGNTITVSGTPTGAGLGAGYSKSFLVSIPVIDSGVSNVPYSQTIGITVPTLVVTGTAPAATQGTPYSYNFGSTGGVLGSKTFSYTGTIPAGTTLSTAGVLSGTPTIAATYAFSVFATDGQGNVSAGSAQSVTVSALVIPSVWDATRQPASTTITESGLRWTATAFSGSTTQIATQFKSTGKRYFEVTSVVASTSGRAAVGLAPAYPNTATAPGDTGNGVAYLNSGVRRRNSANTAGFATWTGANVVVGVAVDLATGDVWVRLAAGWQSGNPALGTSPAWTLVTGPLAPMAGGASNASLRLNTGGAAFAFTPPAGFAAWDS